MIWRAVVFSFFCGLYSLSGQDWLRGSAVILEASSDSNVVLAGSDQALPVDRALPLYIPGLFASNNAYGESLFLRTSNDVDLYFEGAGFFGFERFEGIATEVFSDEQSRMILNVRKGFLILDSTGLSESSRLIVETPFGRLSGARAKWSVRVEFDHRSRIYDFTVSCSEGSVRLTDTRKKRYDIFGGQRIAGAGTYENPSIEVAELSGHNRERFADFSELQDSVSDHEIDRAALLGQMMPLNRTVIQDQKEGIRTVDTGESERPIVIEVAPKPAAVTPFRAEIPPPVESGADLF